MNVLIAGCGYVGTALGQLLVADGHTVFGMRRDVRGLPTGVHGIAADVTNSDALGGLPTVDSLVYAVSPAAYTEAAYRDCYVEGLGLLSLALGDVDRVLLTSSTSYYGDHGGRWVDETDEPCGLDDGKSPAGWVIAGELLLSQLECTAVAVRFGGIYGPGRSRLVRSVRDGTARLSQEPTYTNRIHRDDCAGVLRHLLTIDEPASAYNGVDCDPAERNQVLCWIADQLGVPHPVVGEGGNERRRRGNKRCRNDRLRATGYSFRYPTFREGYSMLIAEERG